MQTAVDNWREGTRTGHTHEPNDVTIRLDGLGRQLADLPVEPSPPDPSDGPVFVDESGRRSKTYRRLGWLLATICAVYAVTLVAAVLGGNSSAPWLPITGQEEKQGEEVEVRPAQSAGTGPATESPGATLGPSASTADTGTVTDPGGGVPASAPGTTAGTGASASKSPAPPSGGETAAEPGADPSASASDADVPTTPVTDPGDSGGPPPTPSSDPSEATTQPREGAQ